MNLDPPVVDALSALALGFTFAGLLCSTFELVARRPLALSILREGGLGAAASVPVIVFSAPLLILRDVVRRGGAERLTIPAVALTTVIACFWSLLSGRLVLDAAHLVVHA